ncbi:cobaltochelatase subunit CobN [Sedimentibacter sp.]|uniref:cobaltochelatase subunit CobN n=1 Tax=Sedimentibacter sp. TaxID=1960295 RepID=UPI00289A123B|nr:cobaltochelatase subunit CobN [Sedimentibacter sp.]
MLRIVYYTAVDANLTVYSNAYKRFPRKFVELSVFHRRGCTSVKVRQQLHNQLKSADVFIVQLMGGKESMPEFDNIMSNLRDKLKVFIFGTTETTVALASEHNNVSDEVGRQLFNYMAFGGQENIHQMLRYISSTYSDSKMEFQPPGELPMNGIYYETEGFEQGNAPKIGMIFFRNYFINGDHSYVDALVQSVEAKDARVRVVYLSTTKSDQLDNKSVDEVLKTYFTDGEGNASIDVLISLIMFSNGGSDSRFLRAIDVPVLQGLMITDNFNIWDKEVYGLTPSSLTINVALPEMDGVIIALPIATKEYRKDPETGFELVSYCPIKERVDKMAMLAVQYSKLRHTDNGEKKIAIIMHNYPPKNETIGCAFGLDTQQSIIEILINLKDRGYKVDTLYENTQELMEDVFRHCTNDEKWHTEAQLNATIRMTEDDYKPHYAKLNVSAREKIESYWGEPAGECMTCEDDRNKKSLLIPGVINGNIFIGIQPQRNQAMDSSSAYHSPDLPMGHHYYAYYQWIKHSFGANAVIHMGKHGSLEWLPGKAVALSDKCHPDCVIDTLPNFYPYIINNPGEGTQAKRRSNACLIGHLEPPMREAELYDAFERLSSLINEYMDNVQYNREISEAFKDELNKSFEETGLVLDFGDVESIDDRVSEAHNYLEEMKETLINNGLHILGKYPEGQDLTDFVGALTRVASEEHPSLREAVAEALGYDLEQLMKKRAEGTLAEKQLISDAFALIKESQEELIRCCIDGSPYPQLIYKSQKLEDVANYIREEIFPKLVQTSDEITNLMEGLNGKFVPTGPSGAPTRGQTEILPTGRNFHTLNPNIIPTQSAWKTGTVLADMLVERYRNENEDRYPENIGVALFGSPTIRTKGEEVAQILSLIGARTVWQRGGNNVMSFEPVDYSELKRPRIDVTMRITGFFRDAFPNIVEKLDNVICRIARLDEPEEMNFIKKHINEEVQENIRSGMTEDEAFRTCTYRIFSAKPGAYGTGVNTLINGKDWKNKNDIAAMYAEFGGYAYGNKVFGEKETAGFKKRLSVLDVAIKTIDTKETDVIANDDNYSYLGGMLAASEVLGGRSIAGYVGDSSNPQFLNLRSVQEETRFVIRTKLLNPRWHNALKKHGFKGATDLSSTIDYVFGWDATTEVIDDLTYQKITESFIENEDYNQWLKDANPWAAQNIIERLLEAIDRGLWQADDEQRQKLIRHYLDNEAVLESKS